MDAQTGTLEQTCRNIAHVTCDSKTWLFRVEQWFIDRRDYGGTADQCHKEMQMRFGYSVEKNCIAPRINELKSDSPNEPRLYATGEKRLTRSGKPATVYAHRMYFKPAAKNPQQSLFEGGCAA
jgi:hypothetical protein